MTRNVNDLIRCLTGHPGGRTTVELAAGMGVSKSGARDYLCGMARKGVISQVGRCILARWCLPQYAAQLRSAQEQHKAAVKLAKKWRHAARARELQGIPTPVEFDFETPVVKRCVAAVDCPPLRPRGPSSVWGLAA